MVEAGEIGDPREDDVRASQAQRQFGREAENEEAVIPFQDGDFVGREDGLADLGKQEPEQFAALIARKQSGQI